MTDATAHPLLTSAAAAAAAANGKPHLRDENRLQPIFAGDFCRSSASFGRDGIDDFASRQCPGVVEERALYTEVESRRFSSGNVAEDDVKSYDDTDDVEGRLVHAFTCCLHSCWA